MGAEAEFRAQIPRLIALAAQVLGWRADHFWDATPEELAMSLGNPDGHEPHAVTREQIEQMMEDSGNG
ncbi:MAG: phage tail assembly chaperone [Pseudomonadota bacterium]